MDDHVGRGRDGRRIVNENHLIKLINDITRTRLQLLTRYNVRTDLGLDSARLQCLRPSPANAKGLPPIPFPIFSFLCLSVVCCFGE